MKPKETGYIPGFIFEIT